MVSPDQCKCVSRLTISPGQFLAVGWSDGYVRLMGLESNKAAHNIRICGDAATAPSITHIGWSQNKVGRAQSKPSQSDSRPWNKLMSEELDLPGNPTPLDLPRELTFLEVDSALPKISPLPTTSAGSGCVTTALFPRTFFC